MYQIGDIIVYRQTGVCRVDGIGKPPGVKGEKPYYTLKPLYRQGTIYVPVDTAGYLRKVMSAEEARAWIGRMPGIPEYVCADSRMMAQKAFYAKAMQTHDLTLLIGMIKGLYRKERSAAGRKLTVTESSFLKAAENCVHQEFACSLGLAVEQIPAYVRSVIEERKTTS